MIDILVIIPAYNEEKAIKGVIDDLQNHGYNNILVVDDGSDDRTFEIANASAPYVARHFLNIGAGSAMATGFEIAKILNPEIVVTFDADGQHSADDIARLIEPIRKDEADVVIGSRLMGRKTGMPRKRVLYNKAANMATFIIYGFAVSDTQSGLKAFNKKAYRAINIETAKMEFCSEIISKIKKNNLRFKEVEIKSIYTDYSMSKGQNFAVGVKTLSRLVLSRIIRR